MKSKNRFILKSTNIEWIKNLALFVGTYLVILNLQLPVKMYCYQKYLRFNSVI